MLSINGHPGLYIVFEGIGGSGKDTQIKLLAERIGRELPGTKFTVTREPGGTEEGQKIRRILLDDKTLTAEREVELFIEDRVLNQEQVVLPALLRGGIVIQNRSWISNMAYQGVGKGLGRERVLEANLPVVSKVPPDLIVFLDVGWEAGRSRFGRVEHDKYDHEADVFWQRVEQGYHESVHRVSEVLPTRLFTLIDGEGVYSIAETQRKLWQALEPYLDLWWRIREGLISHSAAPEGNGKPRKERV